MATIVAACPFCAWTARQTLDAADHAEDRARSYLALALIHHLRRAHVSTDPRVSDEEPS